MKKKVIFWILFIVLLINLIFLIIALTDNSPSNPLIEYRFLIGISFLTIGGFFRKAYKITYETNK